MSLKGQVPHFKPQTKSVRGLPIPKMISEEKFLSGLSYTPTPDDVFIVTYPKSGTTWTQYIVWEIFNFGAPPPLMNDMLNKCIPYLEFIGEEPVKKLSAPRSMKTHLPYHLIPFKPFAKYIYIARNPKDTCISYYNQVRTIHSEFQGPGATLDDFFECFLLGEVPYGDWFDHVLSWYEHKDDPNVLFFTYEMMKQDPRGSILTIARFLGKEYEQRLTSDPSLLMRILDNTSFESMKRMEFYIPKEIGGKFGLPQGQEEAAKFHKVNMFWRGKVGNWKEFLTKEQVERLDEMVLNRPRGHEISALWDE